MVRGKPEIKHRWVDAEWMLMYVAPLRKAYYTTLTKGSISKYKCIGIKNENLAILLRFLRLVFLLVENIDISFSGNLNLKDKAVKFQIL